MADVSVIRKLYNCFVGPKLYRRYRTENSRAQVYNQNAAENLGDVVLKWFKFCYSLTVWTSPFIIPYLHFKGVFTKEGLQSVASYGISVGFFVSVAYVVRGIGRLTNKEYLEFVNILILAHQQPTSSARQVLQQFDFDFRGWPADFAVPSTKRSFLKKSPNQRSYLENLKLLPCNLIGYIAAHTFGIRMVYPGKTALLQTLVDQNLQQGRIKLIEEKGGRRAKIKTSDNNCIDTMFVDRRHNVSYANGNTLVISCEGNAGFYEIGCMCTPLDDGYSVLGWNHPGFAGSTGVPHPEQELAAIDAVIQYAIERLCFKPNEIVLFAWSIGGFSASWAAAQYPDTKSVVLDATFDDILPLALFRMPEYLEHFVKITIRNYINLTPVDFLLSYPGPVLLIRRTKDEMITANTIPQPKFNRGNDFLKKLLKFRYPKLLDENVIAVLDEYLDGNATHQSQVLRQHGVENGVMEAFFLSYIDEHSRSYPMLIEADRAELQKQMVLFLASKYMHDFDTTHCVPLPAALFQRPWMSAAL